MSSREQFEAWIAGTTNSDLHRGIMLDRHENGRYRHLATENKWEAWQEATKQSEAKCAALAAENAGLSAVLMSVIDPSNEPAYQSLGMGCGVEDNSLQTDGYGACEYGWREAMERVYSEVIPEELPETPATDAFLAEVRAQGVDEFLRGSQLPYQIATVLADYDNVDDATLQTVIWSGQPPEPDGDVWHLEYVSRGNAIVRAVLKELRKGVQQ